MIFLKYKEMVIDFHSWMRKFIAPFHFRDEKETVSYLCKKYRNEFNISNEDKWKHKRQIMPGDHIRKMKPEGIEKLNKIFSHSIKTLGYQK